MHRSVQYLARVMMDPAGQYLFLAMLLFSSKPYVMGLGPVRHTIMSQSV